MAVVIAAVLGMIIWIAGWAVFPSPHANFDWFLFLPVFVLIAAVGQRIAPYVRDLLKP